MSPGLTAAGGAEVTRTPTVSYKPTSQLVTGKFTPPGARLGPHSSSSSSGTNNVELSPSKGGSPTCRKTRLVRVRRNSNGVETSRTYTDSTTGEERSESPSKTRIVNVVRRGSGKNELLSIPDHGDSTATTTSPSKTRIAKVVRRGSGKNELLSAPDHGDDATATTSRTYTDNATTGEERSGSPSKTRIAKVVRRGSGKNELLSIPDHGDDSTATTSRTYTDNATTGEERSGSPSKTRIAKVVRRGSDKSELLLPDHGDSTATTTRRIVAKPFRNNSNKNLLGGVEGLNENNSSHSAGSHCFIGAPQSTRNIQSLQPVVEKNESRTQALRLLRVILGEASATVNRETVDRALQKHADLLRLQVQQKQQQQQQQQQRQQQANISSNEEQQQKQLIASQKKMIANLEAELKKQKNLMKTALEIKDVELDIRTNERDQKAVKVQQLSWRLAKERTAAKDKFACVSAAVAASSSLTDRAVTAENELTEQKETIQALEEMVQKTVSALRGKDMFLKQLLGQRTCAMCLPIVTNDDEVEMETQGGHDADSIESIESIDGIEEMSQSSLGQTLRQDIMQRHHEHDGDEASELTPVMGQSGSSGMVLHDGDFNSKAADKIDTLLSTDTMLGNVSSHGPRLRSLGSARGFDSGPKLATTIDTETSTKIAELEHKIEEMERQLHQAQDAIATLEEEKVDMEADFEETLQESQAKVSQLKGVLIACNERRREAEQQLRQLGKYDEDHMVKISKKNPDELVDEIVQREISSRKGASGSISSSVNTTELIKQQTEVESLKQRLAEKRAQHAELESELKLNEKLCKATLAMNAELESQLTQTIKQLEIAQQKSASLEAEHSARMEETTNAMRLSEKRACEYATRLEEATNALHLSETRAGEYEVRLNEANNALELLAKDAGEDSVELEETKILLQQSEAMMADYSSRLDEANVSLQQSEILVAEITARLEGSRNAMHQSERRANGYLTDVAETRIAMQQAVTRVDEYSARLDKARHAMQQSETRAGEYLAELEEVRSELQQSERKAAKYFKKLKVATTTLEESETRVDSVDRDNSESNNSDMISSALEAAEGTVVSEGSATELPMDDELQSHHVDETFASELPSNAEVQSHHADSDSEKTIAKTALLEHDCLGSRSLGSASGSGVLLDNVDEEKDENDPPELLIHTQGLVEEAQHESADDVGGAVGDLRQPTEKDDRREQSFVSREQEHAIRFARLEKELAEKQLQLNDAELRIAELSRGEEDNSSLEDAHEMLKQTLAEVKVLKAKLAESEAHLNEVEGKLIFLRNMVLSVVPQEGQANTPLTGENYFL